MFLSAACHSRLAWWPRSVSSHLELPATNPLPLVEPSKCTVESGALLCIAIQGEEEKVFSAVITNASYKKLTENHQ